MVLSEGNMSLKNPVTPPGIDPGIVRLVAQRLNYYATPGPGWRLYHSTIHLKRLTNTIQNLARLPGMPAYITPCRCFPLYLDIRL